MSKLSFKIWPEASKEILGVVRLEATLKGLGLGLYEFAMNVHVPCERLRAADLHYSWNSTTAGSSIKREAQEPRPVYLYFNFSLKNNCTGCHNL